MARDWKTALQQYVATRNRMESEYTLDPVADVVSDERYMARQTSKLSHLREVHRSRELSPGRSETRLRLEDVMDHGDEVIVELSLRRSWEFRQRNSSLTEERIERERLKIARDGIDGRWRIGKVVSLDQERTQLTKVPKHRVEASSSASGSKPLLNTAMMNRSMPYRAPNYDRNKVAAYADRWWDQANPDYRHFEVDCTNYVSQCIYAGGAPMQYTGNRQAGWWYRHQGSEDLWSFSWAVANSLRWFLPSSKQGLRAEQVESASQLQLGDVICYDWDGDNTFQHNTIITGFDTFGMPLVNAHTTNSRHRYWDYKDSYAWTDRTRYLFFHIVDEF